MHLADFAREACIKDPAVIALLAVGNFGIFVAYLLIPISIARLAARLRRVPSEPLWWLFGAFILGCGFTHLVGLLVLFRPAFYLEAWLCLGTAAVSLVTALLLWRSVPLLASTFRAVDELQRAVQAEQPPAP